MGGLIGDALVDNKHMREEENSCYSKEGVAENFIHQSTFLYLSGLLSKSTGTGFVSRHLLAHCFM